MPKSRSSLKQRSNAPKVVQKVKKQKKTLAPGYLPKARELWNAKETMRSNYASLGLAAEVNKDASVAVHIQSRSAKLRGNTTSQLAVEGGQLQVAAGGLRLEVDHTEDSEQARLVAEEMEEAAANAAPPRLFMFEGDQEFVESLLKKYAQDDYKKMARDHKLNPYQHTPAQIRKKVEKYMKMKAESTSTPEGRAKAVKLPCSTWNVGPGM